MRLPCTTKTIAKAPLDWRYELFFPKNFESLHKILMGIKLDSYTELFTLGIRVKYAFSKALGNVATNKKVFKMLTTKPKINKILRPLELGKVYLIPDRMSRTSD